MSNNELTYCCFSHDFGYPQEDDFIYNVIVSLLI